MSLTLRTTLGCTEVVLDDDGNMRRFYQIADILAENFGAEFTEKEDDADEVTWNFSFGKHLLTLGYSIYNGISIFPTKMVAAKKSANKAVVELASVLEGKLINLDRSRRVA